MAGGRRIRLTSLKALPRRDERASERLIKNYQHLLVRIQQAMRFRGERAVVVFEGMDAAGKGGTIRRIAWALDPRALKVWPIGAPNEIEARQHYLQRFWERLPERGQIGVFDRSWYGRVLVERVEGHASPAQWKRAYGEINAFERQLADDGVRIVKFFLHVSKEEQLRRFEERFRDPLKRWRLGAADLRSRSHWREYVTAIEDMFHRTNTRHAPWQAILSDDKDAARIAVLRILVQRLSTGLDLKMPPIEPETLKLARASLGKAAVRAALKSEGKRRKRRGGVATPP
jgi:polyphosphate kinase 2 (PPK2 family)